MGRQGIIGARRRGWLLPCLVGALAQPVALQAGLIENQKLEHDGRERIYDLYVPNAPANGPRALILDLHGFTLTKTWQRGFTHFDTIAERDGLLVAWPNGVLTGWNTRIGFDGEDDVGFLRALVARISSQYPVDASRVYATGHSMGGGMVYRLACEASDVFAAFAVIAMTLQVDDAANCQPVRPVPVLSVNGLTDPIAPYQGDLYRLSAPLTLEYWAAQNRCTSGPVRDELHAEAWCDTMLGCEDDIRNTLCTVTGVAPDWVHLIYNNTAGLDLAEQAWAFFQRHDLQGGSDAFTINAGLNDAWVSDQAPFQGLFITVYPELGLVFVAWFTFDSPVTPGMAVFGAGDQRWVTGLGVFEGNRVNVELELTTGGGFLDDGLVAIQQAGYGNLELVFSGCDAAQAEYAFPGTGLSGQMSLRRVSDSNTARCQALATQAGHIPSP